ncbi:MAG: hypothetical protein WAK41_12825 [Roseiarcus sp.]|uniref:hypothetical protein n=1 Tax=Roseiarcus sp. TaxID=1969460 RepID=UPI003BB154EF
MLEDFPSRTIVYLKPGAVYKGEVANIKPGNLLTAASRASVGAGYNDRRAPDAPGFH